VKVVSYGHKSLLIYQYVLFKNALIHSIILFILKYELSFKYV